MRLVRAYRVVSMSRALHSVTFVVGRLSVIMSRSPYVNDSVTLKGRKCRLSAVLKWAVMRRIWRSCYSYGSPRKVIRRV